MEEEKAMVGCVIVFTATISNCLRLQIFVRSLIEYIENHLLKGREGGAFIHHSHWLKTAQRGANLVCTYVSGTLAPVSLRILQSRK